MARNLASRDPCLSPTGEGAAKIGGVPGNQPLVPAREGADEQVGQRAPRGIASAVSLNVDIPGAIRAFGVRERPALGEVDAHLLQGNMIGAQTGRSQG